MNSFTFLFPDFIAISVCKELLKVVFLSLQHSSNESSFFSLFSTVLEEIVLSYFYLPGFRFAIVFCPVTTLCAIDDTVDVREEERKRKIQL